MVRYANPTRCPDCRATLPESPSSCPECRLPLTGQRAADLFATLQSADRLLDQLRTEGGLLTAGAYDGPQPAPSAPVPAPPAPPRPGLSALSVPRILLGLGVLCLLVAAITFLVVTWSWLGVGGRTAVLLVLTVASGALSIGLNRRDLRLAGEALSVVAFGLLVLDLVGADNAGWLGTLSGPGLLSVIGAVVGGTGLVLALAQQDARQAMLSPQVFGVAGIWAVPAGIAVESDHVAAVAMLAAAGLLALAGGTHRLAMRLLAILLGLAAASWWLVLLVVGAARAVDHRSVSGLLTEGHGWPLLAAAALLVVTALLTRERPAVAGPLLGGGGVVVSALVLLPSTDDGGGALGAVLVVLLVLWSAVAPFAPRPWLGAVELPVVASALAALGLVAESGVAVLDVLAYGVEVTWSQDWSADVPLRSLPLTTVVPAMLLPLVAALLLAALTWRRTADDAARVARHHTVPALVVLTGTGAAVAVLEALPTALVLAVLVVAAAVLGARAATRAEDTSALVGLAGTAALAALALVVALPSVVLTATTLALLAAASVVLLLRERRPDHAVAWAAAAVLPAALAGLGWSLGEIGDVPEVWRAAPVMVVVGLLALARPWPALEGSAAVFGAAIAVAAVDAAAHEPTALALHLTLAGALVTASSLVHEQRRRLGWIGGLLLAAATWVRLWDLGIDAPEAYTLPSAVALLLVGLRHLSHHPEAGTGRALVPGLVLASVPSLLRVIVEDPVSLRAALLGLGCLALVLVGAALRWQAPLLVGAVVGAALVLREWAPHAGLVPPWVWIAAAGTALLVVGVTWERRLQDLRGGADYLARLR